MVTENGTSGSSVRDRPCELVEWQWAKSTDGQGPCGMEGVLNGHRFSGSRHNTWPPSHMAVEGPVISAPNLL
eukprot:5278995-Pyramimonas_sp.AAC.1